MSNPFTSPTTVQAQTYASAVDESVETWKRDHDEATECLSVEDLIELGIMSYEFIVAADLRWRTRVLNGGRPYIEEHRVCLKKAFEIWASASPSMRRLIDHFRSKGYMLPQAGKFLEYAEEAAWNLAPASEAFGEKMIAVREAAILDFRNGDFDSD